MNERTLSSRWQAILDRALELALQFKKAAVFVGDPRCPVMIHYEGRRWGVREFERKFLG